MATMQCPHCNNVIQKPSNTTAWIVGIVGVCMALMVGGFLFVIVCLSAIAAIGEASDEEFANVSVSAETRAAQLQEAYENQQAAID